VESQIRWLYTQHFLTTGNKHSVNILWCKSSCKASIKRELMRVDENCDARSHLTANSHWFSCTLVNFGPNFDESFRYARGNIQSTLMQLLFSFDRDTRVEKTLMQTLNSHQLSFSFELPHEGLSVETSKFLNKSNEIYDNLRRFKTLWCNIQNT
jgi:hypothetical protein